MSNYKYIFPRFVTALLCCIFLQGFSLTAQEDAVRAYGEANYTEAINGFETLIEQSGGNATAEMYYNLGAAYYKSGALAKAILNFERAYRLNPSDSDIRFNLQLASSQIEDRMETGGAFFLDKWLDGMAHWLPLTAWMWVGSLSFLLLLVGFLLFFLHQVRMVKQVGFYSGIVLFVVSLLANIMVYRSYGFTHDTSEAIIMAPIITVKSAPDSSSQDIVVVHEGLKVKLLQSVSGFAEVQLPDGMIGWVPMYEVERVYPFYTENK